jgi:cobalt-zinc-cadmium efflux system membrane fusion protein
MKRLLSLLTISGAVLVASACAKSSAGTAAESSATPTDGNAGQASAADLTVDAAALRSIAIQTVTERSVAQTLTVAGKVQFDEDRLAHVLAPLAGQVVDLRVKVGDAVRKGQPLCAISSRDATAVVGEHTESHKDLELAEKTAAMTQDLFDHQAASKIALQQAQSDLAKAKARVARNEQGLRLLGLQSEADIDRFDGRVLVVSPIAGSIIERHVTDGQFVQADSMPIIAVADASTVWVMGDVFERDLHLVNAGDEATITTTAYSGERFTGRVNYVSDVIDPMTRTAKVRVSVPNPRSRLKPEMFASIALGVGAASPALTVPASAVFTENGHSWVYVSTKAGHFSRRSIEVDQDEGTERRVLNGLRAGDRVVTGGALLLREEEVKRAS